MSLKATVTVHDSDVATVVSAGSGQGELAKALLDAADSPREVVTVSAGPKIGWQVPVRVAEKAGLVSKPSTRGRSKSTAKAKADTESTSDAGDGDAKVTADS